VTTLARAGRAPSGQQAVNEASEELRPVRGRGVNVAERGPFTGAPVVLGVSLSGGDALVGDGLGDQDV
jgi:hypothetical protein